MSDILDFDDDDLLEFDGDTEDDLLAFDDDDDLLDFEFSSTSYELNNPVCSFRFAEGSGIDPNTFKDEVKSLSSVCDPPKPNSVSKPWPASRVFSYWLKSYNTDKRGRLHMDECAQAVSALRYGSYIVEVEYVGKGKSAVIETHVRGATKDVEHIYVLIPLDEKLEHLSNTRLLAKYYGTWLPTNGDKSICKNWRMKT